MLNVQTVWFTAMLCLAGVVGAADKAPLAVAVNVESAADACEVTTLKDAAGKAITLVTFRSETGIGRAELKPTGKDWPETLRLRIAYREADRDFGTLEGFDFTLGANPREARSADDAQPAAPLDKLTPRHVGNAMEVDVPAKAFGAHRRAFLQWIDFYRG